MEFSDTFDHLQRLWQIDDEAVHDMVAKAMNASTLYIADGHHRYETALSYRDWVKENDPDFSPEHPANFIMMYLTSLKDPGLIVLPAHRMLKDVEPALIDKLLTQTDEYFDSFSILFGKENRADAEKQFLDFLHNLGADQSINAIGVTVKGRDEFFLLKLRPGVMEAVFGDEMPPCVRALDVSVLTQLIFMKVLGFDQARLDDATRIGYSSVASDAVEAALSGEYDVSFILNATRLEQVQDVAQEGEIMPRKSTYFYPKVITGQVFNMLE